MAPLRLKYSLLLDSIMVPVVITAATRITREVCSVSSDHKRGGFCANVSAELQGSKYKAKMLVVLHYQALYIAMNINASGVVCDYVKLETS